MSESVSANKISVMFTKRVKVPAARSFIHTVYTDSKCIEDWTHFVNNVTSMIRCKYPEVPFMYGGVGPVPLERDIELVYDVYVDIPVTDEFWTKYSNKEESEAEFLSFIDEAKKHLLDKYPCIDEPIEYEGVS